MKDDGSEGWAVGRDGVVLRYLRKDVGVATLDNLDDLQSLGGQHILSFDRPVTEVMEIRLIDEKDKNYLTGDMMEFHKLIG